MPLFHRETVASRATFYPVLLTKLHEAYIRLNERSLSRIRMAGEGVGGTRTLYAARNGLKRIHRVNRWMSRIVGDGLNNVESLVRDNQGLVRCLEQRFSQKVPLDSETVHDEDEIEQRHYHNALKITAITKLLCLHM